MVQTLLFQVLDIMLEKFGLPAVIVLISTLVLSSATYAGESAINLTGRWKGNWSSETNGHHGPLQGRFEKVNCHQYEVVFSGRFAKVIPFRYTATLDVVSKTSHGVKLAGSHRLGPIMGTFHYQGYASSHCFVANYSSRHDEGQFRLQRTCR